MLLSDIAERLNPVLQLCDTAVRAGMDKPTLSVPLHRELDELIEMAQALKNAIVL
jgi:hypothetical protein